MFVDDEQVGLLQTLQCFSVLDQYAESRALTDADHDRHRRGKTEAQGQAMISTESGASCP
ncbi:MAG TPA: hypothetical protein VM659_20765 [Dongiaceae bacterium]|nr:hypothetical protein [Dongiaceae bacterium]